MGDQIFCNGIDIDSGDYAVPPMSADELDAVIRGEKEPAHKQELGDRAHAPDILGVEEGVDAKSLEAAGWGVLFAQDADPMIKDALQPLLKLREGQAGNRFQTYAYQAGDTKDVFLSRFGAAPGPADPDKVPYYLLMVGGPAKIPYSFQSDLDVQYAVGRIDFDTPAEYRAYAESVVAAETGQVKLARQATFVGVRHQESDTATEQSAAYLIDPLVQALGKNSAWQVKSVPGLQATKAELLRRLGGSETPSLLFTASHGLSVPLENRLKLPPPLYQGALICADWLGRGHKFTDEACFMAGSHLPKDANLLGLIAFFFACFSAGTPQLDAYTRLQRMQLGQQPGPPLQLAPQPFVADLPRKMLSASGGGALAVIGHVERGWPSSFLWKLQSDGTQPPQTAAFESTLTRLMDGYPVGHAVDYLNLRYAELATMLLPYLEAIKFKDDYDRVQFTNIWMASNDAQWFTIIGDPAVRLPVVSTEEVMPRPLRLSTTDSSAESPLATPPAAGVQDSAHAVEPNAGNRATAPASSTKGSAGVDLFGTPFSPPPEASEQLNRLKEDHPEAYTAYIQHIREGYKNNDRIFRDVLAAFMRSHNSTVAMYWVLFAIGVGAVIAAIAVGLMQNQLAAGAAFIGVGAAGFVAYFISRSTQSVEENLVYISWLGVIYNSYWNHLAWATQRETAQGELDKATTDAIKQMERLLDRHAQSVKGRPTIDRADSESVAAKEKQEAAG